MKQPASTINFLLMSALLTSLSAYPQWFVEREVKHFPSTVKVKALSFEESHLSIPQACPIPKKSIQLVLPLKDQQEMIVGGDKEYGIALYKNGKWLYFSPLRYLLSGGVKRLSVDKKNGIWIETEKGISHLYQKEITLEEKAAIFLQKLRKRHVKFGFIRDLSLSVPGHPEKGGFLNPADNDGLWTSLYVQAEAFRYAVTKDPLAKQYARESLEALMRLESITPISGFPARAIVEKEESPTQHYGGEWHLSKDGQWYWKGDTSSDEIDGHLAAYAVYYDLVADAKEKREIRKVVKRIIDHIIEHNFFLVDVDGKPTTWGRWNPQIFRETIWGKTARGLNSLQILSFLNVAYHMTGEWKYRKTFYSLLEQGYDRYLRTVKVTTHPRFVNHSDDELAVVAYYPFFAYERDPKVLHAAQKGFKRWCQAELPERSPWFNFVCCKYGENSSSCDRQSALQTLEDVPLDTLNWHVKNSHRADVKLITKDRHSNAQLTRVLPISERCFLRWNGNPYRADECGNGNEESDGVFFLLPYWMGRYLGYVSK